MRPPVPLGPGDHPAICWAGDRWLVAIGGHAAGLLVVSLDPDGTELGRNTWPDGWGFPVLEWPYAAYKGTVATNWSAILRDIPSGITQRLTTAHGNAPVALGHGYLLWQHTPAFRVYRRSLATADIESLVEGRPTGLAHVLPGGLPAFVDLTRTSVPGMTKPQRAGDALVGEGPTGGIVVHLGTRTGVLLPGQDCMDPRVAAGPNGQYAAVCWGSGAAGVRVQCFTADDLVAPAPAPIPGPVPLIGAWPRKLWIAPYWSHGRHGDTPIAEHAGNALWVGGDADNPQAIIDRLRVARGLGFAMIVAWPGDQIPAEFLDQTIAWYVHGSSLADLEMKVRTALTWPEKPILAHLDGRGWPVDRPAWMTARVWPDVQAYRNPGESLADFDAAIRADLHRLASWGTFCSLTPAFFTRNGTVPVEHITACMPLYERWVRDYPIVSMLPFADRRGTGMVDHPIFRSHARAFLAAAERPSRWDYWQSGTADPDFVLSEKLKQSTANIALSQAEKARILGLLGQPGPRPDRPPPDPAPGPADIDAATQDAILARITALTAEYPEAWALCHRHIDIDGNPTDVSEADATRFGHVVAWDLSRRWPRLGLNGKRGDPRHVSMDAFAWRRGALDDHRNVIIIDYVGAAGIDGAHIAWTDQTEISRPHGGGIWVEPTRPPEYRG